LSDRNNVLVWI